MRRIFRPDLAPETASELELKQAEVNVNCRQPGFSADAEWKRCRQTKLLDRQILTTLRSMAGDRERCMYCSDSHGTDIDHFWPKSAYPSKMLVWPNLLLCCTQCGRHKGAQFPLDQDRPLLIDPTADNPWEFLEFEPRTGILTMRYAADGSPNVRGHHTVSILRLDGQREAASKGYIRSFRRLKATVERFLEAPSEANQLIMDLREADEHGLIGWILTGSGQHDRPFVDLRERHPAIWSTVMASEEAC